jgi:hypothetical protein
MVWYKLFMSRKLQKSYFFISGVIFCVAFMHVVHAQDTEVVKPRGLQISPIRIDWEMYSGERRVGKFNVKNYASGPRNVTVSVKNFFVSSDSEHVNLFGGEGEHPRHMFNVIDWFSVPNDFVLDAGEAKDIEFAIAVPDGQPTNGYYGTILFQTTNKVDGGDEDLSAAKVGVNYRVGAIVTLAVRGDEEPKISGSLRRFDSVRRWYIDTPVVLKTEMFNDGNMHYKMDGEIVVTRFGKKFTTIKIDPEVMYPDSTRVFTKNVPFDTWDFGIYNAKLIMHSEYDDVVFESEIKNIYVLPRDGLIYSISGIVMSIFCIWFLRNYVTIGAKKKKTQGD